MASEYVKKTITMPRDLSEQLKGVTTNLSAFIAEACQEKLRSDERKAREALMIERCRVRHEEDLSMAAEFFEAEQQAWDENRQ